MDCELPHASHATCIEPPPVNACHHYDALEWLVNDQAAAFPIPFRCSKAAACLPRCPTDPCGRRSTARKPQPRRVSLRGTSATLPHGRFYCAGSQPPPGGGRMCRRAGALCKTAQRRLYENRFDTRGPLRNSRPPSRIITKQGVLLQRRQTVINCGFFRHINCGFVLSQFVFCNVSGLRLVWLESTARIVASDSPGFRGRRPHDVGQPE